MSASSASRWELTETYSPAAIESAPATRPATPAVTIEPLVAPEAATPRTRLPVDTIPSLAPSTAARSQFERRLRWVAGWLMGGRAASSCARCRNDDLEPRRTRTSQHEASAVGF